MWSNPIDFNLAILFVHQLLAALENRLDLLLETISALLEVATGKILKVSLT